MKQNVNMRSIGQALGVSAVTVSKALAGRDGVSDALREQIFLKAQEMGYRYSLTARKLKDDSRDVVGRKSERRSA